jgi:hypothetical protein
MAVEYDTDFRERPECYEIGRGERGVFKVQPYKSELLPLWSFKDPDVARESAHAIWDRFEAYRDDEDFVGMDMARKYLQMGFTRAMRYAKYPGGQKYDEDGEQREAQQWADEGKREAAMIFKEKWDAAKEDADYGRLREDHEARTRPDDC